MKLRFTIRDLCWLTLVLAIAIGWWIEHCRTNRAIDDLQKSVTLAENVSQKDTATIQAYRLQIDILEKRLIQARQATSDKSAVALP